MKSVVVLYAAMAFASVAGFAQGQFLFNTHDLSAGNNLVFSGPDCGLGTGSDLFVEVLAGPTIAYLTPLRPLLPLNRTGADAGYTNPFDQIYTIPGMRAGALATVAYHTFQGSSFDNATVATLLVLGTSAVVLTEPLSPPNEVALGTQVVLFANCIPEPSTWALALLGLGAVLCAINRRSPPPNRQG